MRSRPALLFRSARLAAAMMSVTVLAAAPAALADRPHKPDAPRPALGGDHRQAAGRPGRRDDLPARRQRGRRGVRDAGRGHDAVGHAELGRRDPGADLRSDHEEGRSASTRSAWRRPARRPSSSRARSMRYPPEYGPLAAVTPGTPGGLFTMLAEYGTMSLADVLGAGDPARRRLSDRDRAVQRDRAQQGQDQAVAVRQGHDAAAPGPGARGAGAGRAVPPARPRRDAAASSSRPRPRRSRPARTASRRSTPPTIGSTRATSPPSSSAR